MRFEGDNRKSICREIIFLLPRQLVEGNLRKDNEKGASLVVSSVQQRNLIWRRVRTRRAP